MDLGINTIEDLEKFVADQPPESVTLEYKSSRLLQKSDAQAICKTVSAFANSIGGTFVIGIDASGESLKLDGGWPENSRIDWLHRIINSGTFPAVETVTITEIAAESGKYYIISVNVSPKAPHQGQDQRYYRRRGSHSDPMEHYEIEDIRNRPKSEQLPLDISLFTEGQLLSLKLRNVSPSDPVDNLIVVIDANFEFDRISVTRLTERGLRQMRPSVEHVFLLDSFPAILQATSEPKLHVSVTYDWRGRNEHDSATFYLGDYLNTSIVTPPVVHALKDLSKKVDAIRGSLDKLGSYAAAWENATDGSGLRLSQRTIRSLLKQDQRFDPSEFDWRGYQVILDISADDALSLHHVFGYFGGGNPLEEYNKLSEALRDKFERVFRVGFKDQQP